MLASDYNLDDRMDSKLDAQSEVAGAFCLKPTQSAPQQMDADDPGQRPNHNLSDEISLFVFTSSTARLQVVRLYKTLGSCESDEVGSCRVSAVDL